VKSPIKQSLVILGALALPSLAFAHPGHEHASGLLSGLAHPLFGFDHLLAMLAVGLWGAQLGGRARWALPVMFVAVMLLGGGLGLAGFGLPGVEQGILASVVVLGLALLWARKVSLTYSAGLVGLFALSHGHAHGVEMPVGASAALYALGFATATAALHITGVRLGAWLQRRDAMVLSRIAGAAIGLLGLGMAATM
jgi:urease accessory protein